MSSYTPAPPDNFGALPKEHSRYASALAIVFPVPLERTTTYMSGTRNGPAAIIAASHNMESYDEELGVEPYKKSGIATLAAIDTQEAPLEDAVELLPQPGDYASDFLAAKQIYKTLG